MDKILNNHLGCIKPCVINWLAGFLPSTVYYFVGSETSFNRRKTWLTLHSDNWLDCDWPVETSVELPRNLLVSGSCGVFKALLGC